MKEKRNRNIMLRLTEAELAKIESAKPPEVELATYVREKLLDSNHSITLEVGLRETTAFLGALLSTEHGYEEVLRIYDEHFAKGN